MRARAAGFTLVEVMIVIAIVAILASLAQPSFSAFMANQRVRMAAAKLYDDLMLARATAITHQRPAALMFDNASDWRQGWRVCLWDDDSNDCVADGLIQVAPALSGGNLLVCHSFDTSHPGFIFRPDGRIQGAVPDDSRITVSDTLGDGDASNDAIRSLFFSASGRVRILVQNGGRNGGAPC